MNIMIQKEIEPDVKYKLDKFNQSNLSQSGCQGYVAFSVEEGMCIVYMKQPTGNGPVGVQNPLQNHSFGQFAFRIKNNKLQFFNNNNGWSFFHESAQTEFQMNEADKILLGDENE